MIPFCPPPVLLQLTCSLAAACCCCGAAAAAAAAADGFFFQSSCCLFNLGSAQPTPLKVEKKMLRRDVLLGLITTAGWATVSPQLPKPDVAGGEEVSRHSKPPTPRNSVFNSSHCFVFLRFLQSLLPLLGTPLCRETMPM